MTPVAPRIAVITGGGSGIGRALAVQLSQRGSSVVVVGRREVPLLETTALCPGVAHAVPCDVTDRTAVFGLIEHIESTLGPIDLFIANAGMGIAGEVLDLEPEDWTRIRQVNLDAVVYGVEAVYPRMVKRGRGQLVHIGSAAGLMPRPGMTPYAAAKHAVTGLTLSLRAEAAQHGIGVSLVCPGPVQTDIVARSAARGLDGERLSAFTANRGLTAEACATQILRGVARNQAIVPVTAVARAEWRLWRLSTRLGMGIARLRLRAMRRVGG